LLRNVFHRATRSTDLNAAFIPKKATSSGRSNSLCSSDRRRLSQNGVGSGPVHTRSRLLWSSTIQEWPNARQDDTDKNLARDTKQGNRTTVSADILASFPLQFRPLFISQNTFTSSDIVQDKHILAEHLQCSLLYM